MADSRPEGDASGRAAQRRRLAEGNFGEPDVNLTSNEGTEYPAHSKYLQTACEVFDDLFQVASSDATQGDLPSIPLHETSAIIELVLPLIYRKPATSLRGQPYEVLVSSLELAHRLGMPLVISHISIYLEIHISKRAADIYPLACKLDLAELEERSREAFKTTMNMSDPFDLAELVGTRRARCLIQERLSDHKNKFVEFHDRIIDTEKESDECEGKGCPGALCQER